MQYTQQIIARTIYGGPSVTQQQLQLYFTHILWISGSLIWPQGLSYLSASALSLQLSVITPDKLAPQQHQEFCQAKAEPCAQPGRGVRCWNLRAEAAGGAWSQVWKLARKENLICDYTDCLLWKNTWMWMFPHKSVLHWLRNDGWLSFRGSQ